MTPTRGRDEPPSFFHFVTESMKLRNDASYCDGRRRAPANRLPAAPCREMLILLWRAIRSASVPAGSDSVENFRAISPMPEPASKARRGAIFGPRDCGQLGTNPFLTPFKVFVPLTRCLSFWGSLHVATPQLVTFENLLRLRPQVGIMLLSRRVV